MMFRRALWVLALGVLSAMPVAEGFAQQAARQPLLMEGRATLFQRVILRPGARLTERPDANAPSQPTPGFGVFYVYARQGSGTDGWLEIGAAQDGRTQGWVRAERTMDWKQTMVLAFNNPAGRDRAMFFRDAETPRALWLNTRGGAAEAMRLREAARANTDGPVIALEPENFIDITRQFYLLPILSAQRVENESAHEARLLEVVSAPAQQAPPPPADPDALRNYRGSVVFVVDTTISMGPYIDRTREALKRVVDRIRDTAVRDNFRFGMVAFRDHLGGNPRLEYVTRMVSLPDLAEASDAILPRLSQLTEARESNEGFDEDSLAGIKLALDEVPWQQYGGRFVILITDAGARDAKDPRNQTQMGPEEMRQLAQSEAKQVAIYAIHLKTPEGRNNHARAERQYRELTRFGAAGELYYPINEGNLGQFGQTVDALTDALLAQVAAAVGRPIAGIRAPQGAAERRIAEQAEVVGTAMRLSYLGRATQQTAPDVVRSFVLDQELNPAEPRPERRPLDVRVLLTRNQLSDLATTLRSIIQAQAAARLSPETFFERVRGAAAAAARDPRRMAEFQRLGGAFGEFLQDLPYQSQIMEFTQEEWNSMGAGRRTEIVNALEAKLRLYEEFNRQPSLWVSFDGGRNPGEAMYPVPIDALP
ncbi:MAG: VWA domain-containing protein [Roseomonas sp.]|nr:VWA domain-containing protein [Roseomonas sp.]MCA3289732.1 VWA domain-containing protein [Roseomonas sp.]MCA3292721.1 VWA domain-containing protein [Roseomonas sp.]